MDIGEVIYEHYERYFKKPATNKIFEGKEESSSIQVLGFNNVIKNCKVFCSLGLTHYSVEVGSYSEVVLVVDDGFNQAPVVLANSLFHIVNSRMRISDGTCVKGIKNISEGFYSSYQKDAIYFTEPFCFPDSFASVVCSSGFEICFYLAILLSEDEAGYLSEYGPDRLEGLLEAEGVDVFDIKRKSIV